MKLRPRTAIVTLLLVALAAYLVEAVPALGLFYRPSPHGTEGCARVGSMPGPEDMELDPATGTVWIASARRRGGQGFRSHDGAIFAYRPGIDREPTRVAIEGLDELGAHGLGLWLPAQGQKKLFLVNHRTDGDSVEIVRIEAGAPRLIHERTVRDPLFISLNDVSPAGPEAFYATNDHGSAAGLGHALEDFAFLARASVVAHDGRSARQVARGLRYANGVFTDRDRPRLYVTETTGRRLRVYHRGEDLRLEPIAAHDLGSSPDNISLGADGALFIAAHPTTIAFLRHARDGERRSPSQVLRVRLGDTGSLDERTELYLDSGDPISGSSVAVPVGTGLLVGGVFDAFVLDCRR